MSLGQMFAMSLLLSVGGPIHHSSSEHYYSPPHGPKEDRNWSPHMDSYELMVSANLKFVPGEK